MPDIKILNDIRLSNEEILKDYTTAYLSREVSLTGRKEVFMGKAKFGIFGDGKEVAQVAMAKAFKQGDWRSGYYRDQTFIFAIGSITVQEYFAQIYAHTDLNADPSSGGRMMNGHFGTRLLDEQGLWKDQKSVKNTASDVSSTGGQTARTIGLGYASKYYRHCHELPKDNLFSENGNEVVFHTIGNASTSEGVFLEAINASAVMQLPIIHSVWDDGYGISVPNKYQTAKESISEALAGFQKTDSEAGLEIFKVKGWDYVELCKAYASAAEIARSEHIPSLIHVDEITQPQGHSTSGSHERYKSEERLNWEKEYDCIKIMRQWILDQNIATEEDLQQIENTAKKEVKEAKNKAWKAYRNSIKVDYDEAIDVLNKLQAKSSSGAFIKPEIQKLSTKPNPLKTDIIKTCKSVLRLTRNESSAERNELNKWLKTKLEKYTDEYSSHQYSESNQSISQITPIAPAYDDNADEVDGREIINAYFHQLFANDPRVFAFGEDVGKIGDVNQGMAGLQDKFGELRIHDTGIREMTIIGEGTGAAMRGLKPIAEIQYLDYLVYALNTLTDDVACMQYRTKGGQKAPMIVRTRGHRLEGIWHSGSPMSMILGSLRGIRLLVPRNFTQAARMYNTLIASDEPAVMVECLNAYRQKEIMPSNLSEMNLELGKPEILKEGNDITIVTYGAMCRIVLDAANKLEQTGISAEVIDVQTLLPFDVHHDIIKSIQKTNRVIFADEDAPGGASAYMMQKVVEEQDAYKYLDSAPATISAKEHRPAYSTDGDYFSKPNPETIFDKAYEIISECYPDRFPELY
ncbi:alpha-ketoacid dehydrogenase subunit alpha/beta [Aureibacter tunicatorum]|uniref:3-methyl-2-oxobutanoate dehydrogenase (2-methylpropanoyl-transferring) n=1 Tax=Aureibacter tunicatorum TaxID=866807 RepID=A0AAE3XLW0_9BACT|nr:thiamine pyrophosphate-dependent enzyme [Aureibacter tunicatorum]MDR6240321.1 pyruvate/2-oxoglutarate/acetoin dehydrogenase E1 component/TPP-dependent pyruvate/acetoin dehydrogenase alpha subunit [Aureibacter tunicatorum]BDD05798.1 transketolase [Aureibacter tunicatorum]